MPISENVETALAAAESAAASASTAAQAADRAVDARSTAVAEATAEASAARDEAVAAAELAVAPTATQVAAVFAERGGIIFLDSYPRLEGETDDSPRLARAIAAAASLGARTVRLGATIYTLATTVNVTEHDLTIEGAGYDSVLTNATNSVLLEVTGNNFTLRKAALKVTDAGRTAYSLRFTNASDPLVEDCRFEGITGSWRAGIHFNGGSMGTVRKVVCSHACIRVDTWDVKIIDSWVWGMTCEYAIGVLNGAGNTTIINTDVVPPLRTTANARAGIVVDGDTGNPFNTKIIGVYLDGNPTLDCREGIIVGDGAGATLIQGVNANRMNSDCIVIDSAYNVLIEGYTGHTNNEGGTGAREIVVRQTGGQSVEKVVIRDAQCLRTTAVTGTAGPAIEVDAAVAGDAVVIEGAAIKQPSGGGGYSLPEVKVPVVDGYPIHSISAKGQLSRYSAVGSVAVASGATGATVHLAAPYPMAYRPRPGAIGFAFEGVAGQVARVQYVSDNQLYVHFVAALAAAGTLHWRADLRR